jgi:hypothetical protein
MAFDSPIGECRELLTRARAWHRVGTDDWTQCAVTSVVGIGGRRVQFLEAVRRGAGSTGVR